MCFATTTTKTATTKTSTTFNQTTPTPTPTTTTTTNTSTSTAVPGQLPTATYGVRPPSCNYLCTHQKFNSNTCDAECNNYDCRYDHGACSRDMAASTSHARTLGMVQKPSEALSAFEGVCARYHVAMQLTDDGANPGELGDVCKDGRTCKHGTCNETAEGVGSRSRCDCRAGWTGTSCQANIDDCKKDSCSYESHGVCIDGVDSFTCNCKPGWSGTDCEVK